MHSCYQALCLDFAFCDTHDTHTPPTCYQKALSFCQCNTYLPLYYTFSIFNLYLKLVLWLKVHKVGLLCRMRLSVDGSFVEIPIERNGLHDSAPDLILHLIFSGSMLLKSLRVRFPRAVGLKIFDSETILRTRGEVGYSRLS